MIDEKLLQELTNFRFIFKKFYNFYTFVGMTGEHQLLAPSWCQLLEWLYGLHFYHLISSRTCSHSDWNDQPRKKNVTNPCFLLCSTDSLPCDHLCLGESGPDSAERQLYTYWSTWLERLNWIFLAHYPFASPYYTVCQINTLPAVPQALPLAQTNKQMWMQL